jgi:hypothetical protein
MICSVVAIFGQIIRRKPPEGGLHLVMPHGKSLPTPRCRQQGSILLQLGSDSVVNIAHFSEWATAKFDLSPPAVKNRPGVLALIHFRIPDQSVASHNSGN